MGIGTRLLFKYRESPDDINEGGGEVSQDHPRLLFAGQSDLETFRETVRNDAAFHQRWQTALDQWGSSTSSWNQSPGDPFANAYCAFLNCVRTDSDNLGLDWPETRDDYLDVIKTNVLFWAEDEPEGFASKGLAVSIIYDCLYDEFSPAQHITLKNALEAIYTQNKYLGTSVEVYDNGGSDDQISKIFAAMLSDNYITRQAETYLWAKRTIETNDWMGYGFGLGREYHEGAASRHGLFMLMHAFMNTYGYSEAETFGLFYTHMRDNWDLCQHSTIPHPAASGSNLQHYGVNDKFHTQDPITLPWSKSNSSAIMLWTLTSLPGHLDLNGTGISDQSTLAPTEAAFMGYVRTKLNFLIGLDVARNPTNYSKMDTTSLYSGKFWSFPAWLIHNVQLPVAVTKANSGRPKVRRYWPGTTEWTVAISEDHSLTTGTILKYRHRRYGASSYEEGCRQNGSWTVHRNGPLLIQRGETGHGTNTRRNWWCANGVVGFVDANLWPIHTYPDSGEFDSGGNRIMTADSRYKETMLSAGAQSDFGQVETWYADEKVIAISSDLTRSYNSTLVQSSAVQPAFNERKISHFTREFIATQRGADGTQKEKIFTYDRIVLTEEKHVPHYVLCPATDPIIDGTETEDPPHGPSTEDGLPTTPTAKGAENFPENWYVVGPTHWIYPGATKLTYSNTTEPAVSPGGTGRACVTWLEPSGSNVRVLKAGGNNARTKMTLANGVNSNQNFISANGLPFFGPWRGWSPKTEWAGESTATRRAYTGTCTITLNPTDTSTWTNSSDPGKFLVACEVMTTSDTPATAAKLTTDSESVGAYCGETAVIFKRTSGTHTSGSATIPAGVVLLVFSNFPPGALRTLTPGGSLTIESEGRTASAGNSVPANTTHNVTAIANIHGRLVVELGGQGGTISWS